LAESRDDWPFGCTCEISGTDADQARRVSVIGHHADNVIPDGELERRGRAGEDEGEGVVSDFQARVEALLEDGRHFALDEARDGEVAVGWAEIDTIAAHRGTLATYGSDIAASGFAFEPGFHDDT